MTRRGSDKRTVRIGTASPISDSGGPAHGGGAGGARSAGGGCGGVSKCHQRRQQGSGGECSHVSAAPACPPPAVRQPLPASPATATADAIGGYRLGSSDWHCDPAH